MLGDGKQKNLVQISNKGKRFFFSSEASNQLWGPPRLLFNLGQGLFTEG